MDPEYVSRVVSEFFDKYSGGEIDENFSINFESLFAAISARIRNEEEALYAEYEEIKPWDEHIQQRLLKSIMPIFDTRYPPN